MTKHEKYHARLLAVGVVQHNGGGITYFSSLTGEKARWLLNQGAASSGDCQNDAPSFEEITTFLEAHPKFVGHGYIVLPERSDERITLEGVISEAKLSKTDKDAFTRMFRHADEFELSATFARAWYD